MFHLIKQVITVLLSFSGSSTTKCVSLDNEPCIANLNPDKHDQYCVTTQLCLVYIVFNGNYNTFDDMSSRIYVSNKKRCKFKCI